MTRPAKKKWDGKVRLWSFGTPHKTEIWEVEAPSFARAVRLFRVGCLFPHACTTGRIRDKDERDGHREHYLSSKPGATIRVSVFHGREGWKSVGRIPVVDDGAEYDPKALPATIEALSETGPDSKDTALVRVNQDELRPRDVLREEMAKATVELERRKAELEAMVREMNRQVMAMREELGRRMKQVWLIELFLGSKEEVTVLRRGAAAPAGEKVAVYQRVLCMDEELAVWHLIHAPEQVKEFCYENLDDFDQWLLRDPSHVDQIIPHQKGIAALRVRRHAKQRDYGDSLPAMMAKMAEEEADRMTYLLVRNGEQLYRLWVDVKLWPRFFPRANEWDWLHDKERSWMRDEQRAQEEQEQYTGGLLVLQGLVKRSTLFAPIDPAADAFAPDMEKHFHCIRNDENVGIGDGETVTWNDYRAWLGLRLRAGVRVAWRGRDGYHDKLEDHIGIRSISAWPSREEVYELAEAAERDTLHGYEFSFLYLPDEEVWTDWYRGSKPREKRIRFWCSKRDVWPIDYVSWRVARSLLLNRGEREHYAESFPMIARWYRLKKAEQEREQPFVDLALRQAELGEEHRARAERILRWWKVKTKTHRDLGVDEAKALRMCVQALRRGDDPNDPEKRL